MATPPSPAARGRGDRSLEQRPPPGSAGAPAGLLPTVGGVVRSPTSTFRDVAFRRPLGQATVVVVVVTGLLSLVQAFDIAGGARAELVPEALAGGLLVGLPAGLVSFVLWVLVVLGFAKLLGGGGTFRGTFCGLGFAYVPLGFAAIISVVALPFGSPAAGVVVTAFLGTMLWSLVLDVIAAREVHRLRTGGAVAAVLLPFVLAFVIVIVLFGALVVALFTAL